MIVAVTPLNPPLSSPLVSFGFRAGLEQRFDDVVVPVAGREHERGEAARRMVGGPALHERRDVRAKVRVAVEFEQRLDDVDVAFGRGPHHRRFLLGNGLAPLTSAPFATSRRTASDAAGARRGHQRRFGVRTRELRIGAGLEQGGHDRHVA